jgi:hypothetical protein
MDGGTDAAVSRLSAAGGEADTMGPKRCQSPFAFPVSKSNEQATGFGV